MNNVTVENKLATVDLKPLIGTEVKLDAETLASGKHAAELRALLEERGVLIFRGVNLSDEQLQAWQTTGVRSRPLVWTHQSGRKSRVLGCTADRIEGMGVEEGRLLLTKLLSWSTQPQFVYTHSWRPGDLLIWDNTGTMH